MKRLLTSFLLLAAALAALLLLGRLAPPVEAAAELPAAAAQGRDAGGDEDTFSPSEKLPADSTISFPVDI